jgi:hypothetical protein
VMSARLRLSWGMKTLKLFLLSVLESLEFGRQVIYYALIFVSASSRLVKKLVAARALLNQSRLLFLFLIVGLK